MPEDVVPSVTTSIVARTDECIGEMVDCRVQHRAAEFVAIRGKIGSPAGEPKAQRGARPDGRVHVGRQAQLLDEPRKAKRTDQ